MCSHEDSLAQPETPNVQTKQIKIEDDLDEETDNCIKITEISGYPPLGTACKIWDCGIIMAKYIHNNLSKYKKKLDQKTTIKILELGSGTGVLGLYLASQGLDVILSDLPVVCDTILRQNLDMELNQKIISENNGKASIKPLDW